MRTDGIFRGQRQPPREREGEREFSAGQSFNPMSDTADGRARETGDDMLARETFLALPLCSFVSPSGYHCF